MGGVIVIHLLQDHEKVILSLLPGPVLVHSPLR